MTIDFAIVVPTVGRDCVHRLLAELDASEGPRPIEVIVVDDRADIDTQLSFSTGLPVTLRHSGGRGPAAARNVGWRSTKAPWVCFLNDDVVPQSNWFVEVADDIA